MQWITPVNPLGAFQTGNKVRAVGSPGEHPHTHRLSSLTFPVWGTEPGLTQQVDAQTTSHPILSCLCLHRQELHPDHHRLHKPTASRHLPQSHQNHGGRSARAPK